MGASSPGYLDHGFSPKFKTVLFRSREQLKATENRTPTTVEFKMGRRHYMRDGAQAEPADPLS